MYHIISCANPARHWLAGCNQLRHFPWTSRPGSNGTFAGCNQFSGVCLVCDSPEPGSHLRYRLWPARLTGHRVSLIGSHLYTTWLAQKIDWLALQLHAACAFVSLHAGPCTGACFLRAWLAGNGRSQRFPGAWPVTSFCMS
jgi:hypothetical protein